MGTLCMAGIAFGYYIEKEDEKLLQEKFGNDIWEILNDEYDNPYPFEFINLNSYSKDICHNLLGIFVKRANYCEGFNPAEITLPADQELKVWQAIEELLGHTVVCKYYLFTKWW
jgi:hypothetical protein